jgi:hypothetical protein
MSDFIRFALFFGVVFGFVFAFAWQLARRKTNGDSLFS